MNLFKPRTYDKLYLRILNIGQSMLGEGLSYNDLLEKLKHEGYDINNDCVEISIRHWFYESFFHIGNDENPYGCIANLENHKDCGFVLKGEHCLVLMEHKTSKRNIMIAWIAIILTIIGLAVSLYQTKLTLDELQTQRKEQQQNNPANYPQQNPAKYQLPSKKIDSLKEN